jgi:peptide/nickel transport system permease protein
MVIIVVFASLAASLLAPYPADAGATNHLEIALQAPSAEHRFGTDQLGRDVLSRVMFGGQTSLAIGLIVILVSGGVGVCLGLVSGYLENWPDEVIMRGADVFLGMPSLVVAMLVALTLGGGPEMTAIAISLTTWPRFARLMRGEVLRVKNLDYVEAARSYGAPGTWIVIRHIFPATVPALIAQGTLLFAQAILVASALGFLGLGAQPPSPEWGLSIAIGREYLPESWWISLFPGLAIVIVVVGLNFLGDAVRVALDARTDNAI